MSRVVAKRGRRAALTNEELCRDPKKAKLHANHVVPLDFFREALRNPSTFLEPAKYKATSESGSKEEKASSSTTSDKGSSSSNALSTASGATCQQMSVSTASVTGKEPVKRFGLYSEALLRDCYLDLLREIDEENTARNERVDRGDETGSKLIEIRGSAGIGKSAFLALLMAGQKIAGLKDFALFHAPKMAGGEVTRGLDGVLCSVWIDGELKMDGKRYGLDSTLEQLQSLIPDLEAIFMDGCSIDISLEDFSGMIYVAASPTVSTVNIKKALGNHYTKLHMPPWSLKESIVAGDFLGVKRDVVEANYVYMSGIVRYMFKMDIAKEKVEDAVKMVNPQVLADLVASGQTDMEKENAMVHALVLWQPKLKATGKYDYRGDVRFEIVSRFAEKKVAEKLSKSDSTDELSRARRLLSPVSGAEGYAGALFEAYAIKKICGGGTFNITRLEAGGGQDSMDLTIPCMNDEPVVVDCNTLTPSTISLDSVHVKANDGSWLAKVLWPLTSNFPTFDCFYFHTDGEAYPLQMTIAQTHDLENNGAYQTMEYLDKIDTCKRPYKAVFVCPKENCRIKRQKFTGNVKHGKQVLVEEAGATKMMDGAFQQWILQL